MTSLELSLGSRRLLGALLPFWRWWTGELAALTPARLTRWLSGTRERAVICVDGGQATLFREGTGRRRRLGTIDLAAASASEVRRLLASDAPDVILELPAAAALRRKVALPLAAEANLAEVVSFELERHTPFRRNDVRHAFRIIERDSVKRRVLVELTVVPRSVTDDALRALRVIQLTPATIVVAAENESGPPSPNLWSSQSVPRRTGVPRLVLAALGVGALSLSAAALVIPLQRAHHEAARLGQLLETARQQAGESARLQNEIDAEISGSGFLTARKRQAVPISLLLDTLTRVLPDDTWLTGLRVTGNEFQIMGLGASASSIIALIDETQGFSDAGFRSPVTQDQALHREQFDIGAHFGPAVGP